MPNREDTELAVDKALIYVSAPATLKLRKFGAVDELLKRALVRELIPTQPDQEFPPSSPETPLNFSFTIDQRTRQVFEYLELVFNKPDPEAHMVRVLCAAVMLCVPEAVTHVKLLNIATQHRNIYNEAYGIFKRSRDILDRQIRNDDAPAPNSEAFAKIEPDVQAIIALAGIVEALDYKKAQRHLATRTPFSANREAKLLRFGAILRDTYTPLANFFYEVTPVKDPKIVRTNFRKAVAPVASAPVAQHDSGEKVVSLDAFRKKDKGEKPSGPGVR